MKGITSAEIARIRLFGVTEKDRRVCGDGKWIRTWSLKDNPTLDFMLRNFQRIEDGTTVFLRGKKIDKSGLQRMMKDHYRWTPRK